MVLSVDLTPVADANHHNDEGFVVNGVQNSVVALPDPILLRSRQFLAARRTRVLSQALDSGDDPTPVAKADSFEFLGSGWLDEDAIACHGA